MIMEEKEKRVPCPINNGADLQSGEMLCNLFDEGQYTENRVDNKYIALGFVGGIPVRCEYRLGDNRAWVIALLKKKQCDFEPLNNALPVLMSDEQVEAKVFYLCNGYWLVSFYYRNKD